MNYVRLLIISLSCLLVANTVFAVEVGNLYTGKILVNDKTQKTRVKAHRWAIEQVLSKVSGDKDILNNDKIKREIQYRTANYIKSFAFKTDEQGRTFLVDQFYQSKIEQLIKSVGGAIWGSRRPNTLIWLAIEEGVNRTIVELEQYPQLAEILTQSADNRGLPLLLPLMDEVDKKAVYSSDVWARFDGPIARGTKRYNTDHFVMARMRYVNGNKESNYKSGWLLQFQLMQNNTPLLSSEFLGDQFTVLRNMINNVGDYFASKYAIDSEHAGIDKLELILENVANIVELTQAEQYLSSLPPVTAVQLVKINNQQAQFHLDLSGNTLDVERALALLPEFSKQKITTQSTPVEEMTLDQQLKLLTQNLPNAEALMNTDTGDEAKVDETKATALVTETQDTSISGAGKVQSKQKKITIPTVTLKYKWEGK